MERVQKILAHAGVASRRTCEELIRQGRVTINGKTAKIGDAATDKDDIKVDGKPITKEEKTYYIMNKPNGYVTTVRETHGMKTIMDMIKTKERVYPVGRLDKNSEGLLLLTNDGELANKLTHPRFGIEKEYKATVDRIIQQSATRQLRTGTMIDERKVRFYDLEIKGDTATFKIHEGRKHIVRRVFNKHDYTVKRLIRTRIGPIKLGDLEPGKYRKLKETEITQLKRAIKR